MQCERVFSLRGYLACGALAALLALCCLPFNPAAAQSQTTLRVDGLDVSRIEVHGAIEVEISQADTLSLVMRGPQADMDIPPFHAREDVLLLGYNPEHKRRDFRRVRYKLSLPVLEHLRVAGSGEVYLQARNEQAMTLVLDGSGNVRLLELSAAELALRVNGSGDISAVQIDAQSLDAVLAGSGDIRLDQLNVRELELGVRGSGDIEARSGALIEEASLAVVGSGDVDLHELDMGRVEVSIVGSGDVRVGRAQSLEVTILGSGDVHYAGDPEKNLTVLGSGSLHRADR